MCYNKARKITCTCTETSTSINHFGNNYDTPSFPIDQLNNLIRMCLQSMREWWNDSMSN